MKLARNASFDPTSTGPGDSIPTDLMFLYQSVAFEGSMAKSATSSLGREISMVVVTSTGMTALSRPRRELRFRDPLFSPKTPQVLPKPRFRAPPEPSSGWVSGLEVVARQI